jgi:SP family general alpha glucoside:H+ symporter-like MFS transporter
MLAPESPWWLTRKGRYLDAERAVKRLVVGVDEDFAKRQVAMMHHTNEMEKAAKVGSNFADCFRGSNLRRTEIACMVWLIQTLCGSPLMGQATYFFVGAGLSDEVVSPFVMMSLTRSGCDFDAHHVRRWLHGHCFILDPYEARRTKRHLLLWPSRPRVRHVDHRYTGYR